MTAMEEVAGFSDPEDDSEERNDEGQTFSEWMGNVARIMDQKAHVTPDDLADEDYRDMFDSDYSAEDAVKDVLENNGLSLFLK
jgi:hypothetical protein